jgi:hypothetical protein
MIKEEIVREICQIVAKYEPFTLDDIINAFSELNSMDRLFYAIELAKRQGCKLEDVVKSEYPIKHMIPSEPYSPGSLIDLPSKRDSQRKAKAKVNLGFRMKIKQ